MKRFSAKQNTQVDWASLFSHFPNELAETERYLKSVNQEDQEFKMPDETTIERDPSNLRRKKDKKEQREVDNQKIYDQDDDDQSKEDQTFSHQAGDDSNPYPNYTRMRSFLFNGIAFAKLRQNLTRLVREEPSVQLYTEPETRVE